MANGNKKKHFWHVFNNKIDTTALLASQTASSCSAKILSKYLSLTTRN